MFGDGNNLHPFLILCYVLLRIRGSVVWLHVGACKRFGTSLSAINGMNLKIMWLVGDASSTGWIIPGTLEIICLRCCSSLAMTGLKTMSRSIDLVVKLLLVLELPGFLLLGVTKVLLGSWISGQIVEDPGFSKFRILGCKTEGVASWGLWSHLLSYCY